ncbi:MAG: glycosyltransferase family 4 protein [Planctomycetota bacterium]|jgi:glycosyltransferase involved in cell wall biosynthesis
MKHTPQSVSTRRPHWLCIAYAFPPINRSGTHRTLAFVRHLDRLGWDATVLTVEPKDEPVDNSLMQQVPESAGILRAPWIDLIERGKKLCRMNPARVDTDRPASSRRSPIENPRRPASTDNGAVRSPPWLTKEFVSRLLITPDSRTGWIWPAVKMGMRHIRRRRPDVVYSTSPYMSAHLIALILSRRTGMPWVADFRDPWRDNPFCEPGFAVLERWDAWLEKMVLRRATHVVCSTPTMAARLCERLPLIADKCSTILNGFDPGLLDTVEPVRNTPSDTFLITHAGQFYGPRSPNTLFSALRRALDQSPELAGRMQIALIGQREYDGRDLHQLAVEAGVGDDVKVLGQKSHAETIAYLAGSDALMLVGSSGVGSDLQVPNKLFEYLAIRKPIIATLPAHSPAVDIIKDARAQVLVCDPDDPTALANAMVQLAKGDRPSIDGARSGVAQFDRAHRAAELADIFYKVASKPAAAQSDACAVSETGACAVPEGRRKVAQGASPGFTIA